MTSNSQKLNQLGWKSTCKNTKPILIGSIYRPPNSSVQWIKAFSLQTEKAVSAADEIYFLEDFNINLLSDDTQESNMDSFS